MKLKILILGIKEFIKRLIIRSHPSIKCERGHEHLTVWPYCKECAIIDYEFRARATNDLPTTYLFSYEGPHAGEIRAIRGSCENISPRFDADYCVTPTEQMDSKVCIIDHDSRLNIASSDAHKIKVNKKTTQKAQLFDYDEVKLMGNSFLVLRSYKEFV